MPAAEFRCPVPFRLPDPIDPCATVDEVHNFLAYFFCLISDGHDRELAERDADKFHVDGKGLYELTYNEWRASHSKQCCLEELPALAILSSAACFGTETKEPSFVRLDRTEQAYSASASVAVDLSLEFEDPWIVLKVDGVDLYGTLGVSHTASKAEVKKAYHKAALTSHPDKVPEDERAEADVKFKAISKAYEILSDDDTRHLYDTQGMQAFEAGNGPNSMGVDVDDLLAQMMGMSMGGGMPPGFGGAPRKPRKSKDEEQTYSVTLEDLYKGKTTKFASTKNVICTHCTGTGGKAKAKSRQCSSCKGEGVKEALRAVGPHQFSREIVYCSSCSGKGTVYNPSDWCKKCHGDGVTKTRKVLELYIPRGAKDGDVLRLEGEADQIPGQEPGDIVFTLEQEEEHRVFERKGADLLAQIEVTLAEALCGFSRVVIKHLDGRGIKIRHPQPAARVLNPDQVIKIPGEGMPHKKSDLKGDLYLTVKINFPDYAWLEKNQALSKLKRILPEPEEAIEAGEVDDVEYDETADIDDFGAGEDDFGAGEADGEGWEDDEEIRDGPECRQQ